MPPINSEDEKWANEAANMYRHNETKNIAELQQQFKAPYHLIWVHIHSCKTWKAPQPGNKILDPPQEGAGKMWIKQLDEAGHPPTNEMLGNCVNVILCWSHTDPTTPPKTVSKMYTYDFMNNLPPEYKRVKQKPKNTKPIQAEGIEIVKSFYICWKYVLKTYNVHQCNYYVRGTG